MSGALLVPSPDGRVIEVPFEHAVESAGADPAADYRQNGYVIARRLIPAGSCANIQRAFNDEVRPHRGFLFRQTSGRPERHVATPGGFMANPLINVQDLQASAFPRFRSAALAAIGHPAVTERVEALLGEPGKVIQTMCFEGNPQTPPHQDTYYLDSTRRGTMVAAWIALEDIHAGAGRFYVCPGSQRSAVASNSGDFDSAVHHDRYLEAVVETMRARQLEVHAPAMGAGDVLFWNARTIHGSLPAVEPSRSRFSLTAHYIPATTGYLQLERRVVPEQLESIGGVSFHHQRDQARLLHRTTLVVAGHLPRTYTAAKHSVQRLLSLRPRRA